MVKIITKAESSEIIWTFHKKYEKLTFQIDKNDENDENGQQLNWLGKIEFVFTNKRAIKKLLTINEPNCNCRWYDEYSNESPQAT